MSTISKTFLVVIVGILVGGATYVMAAPGEKSSPKASQVAAMTKTRAADVKGPCDEAEHANDPRCAGPQQPENRPNDDRNRNDDRNAVAGDDGPLHDVGDDNPGEHHGNRGPGSQNSGPGSSRSDDGPNHDVGDDHGVDGPNHDVGDDHGVDGPNHDVGDDHGGRGADDSGSGHSGSDG
jgi:hypothetical protein